MSAPEAKFVVKSVEELIDQIHALKRSEDPFADDEDDEIEEEDAIWDREGLVALQGELARFIFFSQQNGGTEITRRSADPRHKSATILHALCRKNLVGLVKAFERDVPKSALAVIDGDGCSPVDLIVTNENDNDTLVMWLMEKNLISYKAFPDLMFRAATSGKSNILETLISGVAKDDLELLDAMMMSLGEEVSPEVRKVISSARKVDDDDLDERETSLPKVKVSSEVLAAAATARAGVGGGGSGGAMPLCAAGPRENVGATMSDAEIDAAMQRLLPSNVQYFKRQAVDVAQHYPQNLFQDILEEGRSPTAKTFLDDPTKDAAVMVSSVNGHYLGFFVQKKFRAAANR